MTPEEALERILQSVQPVDLGDQSQVQTATAILRKFIKKNQK
jgi:hypothetical protein